MTAKAIPIAAAAACWGAPLAEVMPIKAIKAPKTEQTAVRIQSFLFIHFPLNASLKNFTETTSQNIHLSVFSTIIFYALIS